ncbi:MAG: Wzz/FepE/Etk N-terminal domain-containing protein [Syntrophales bacterium]|nr:Wzz/FepE/Etk N-terminal domain-containing protein [Syntrophales bacterium]
MPENAGVSVQTDPKQYLTPRCEEDEINLLDYWRVIWKRRKLIGYIVAATVLLTVVVSLFMTNIYRAETVIMPVTAKEGGGMSMLTQQIGGLAALGISSPGSSSMSEIMALLKSNIVQEKMIQQYNLMPVLFYEQWDEKKRTWKKGNGFSLNPLHYVSLIARSLSPTPPAGARKKDPGIPDTWDALRKLDDIVIVKNNMKEGTIILTVDFHDPDMAAKLADYFLLSLTNYMSSEAKRVANTNRKYLEEQLATTNDPFIKQKNYNLIAQQIETAMMAEVKENFAFKIIDPPLAPDKKFKPKRSQMVMISFVVALFMGIFVAFFLEYLEKQNINISIGKLSWLFGKR